MHTTTTAIPAVASVDFRELPIDQVFTSPLNPRKTLNEEALKELAQSIREKGIIEPLVVREATNGDFEIVAGERRYRAAELAGLDVIPCVVRVLSDAEVVEHALTENHQRRDVHPLEEAEAIQQLLDLDSAYTIAGVAAKLGVSHTWVYGRLKLLRMSEPAREAYRFNAITAEHADILARVPAHQQGLALEACFSHMLYEIPGEEEVDPPYTVVEAIAESRWELLAPCLVSAAELRRHVARHSTVDIADEAVQSELPALAEALADAAADEAALLQVSLDPRLGETDAKALGVIRRGRWIEIDEDGTNVPGEVSTARCEHMRQAAVTHPVTPKVRAQGARIVTICTKRSCQVHRPTSEKAARHAGPAASPKETERQRQAAEAREKEAALARERARVWAEEQRPKYLAALVANVAKVKTLTTDLVRDIVDDWVLEQIEQVYGITLTPKTIVTVLLLSQAPTDDYLLGRDSRQLEEFGKKYGLTPALWEKQQKAAKPAKPAAAKKSSPKPVAKAKKKGGR